MIIINYYLAISITPGIIETKTEGLTNIVYHEIRSIQKFNIEGINEDNTSKKLFANIWVSYFTNKSLRSEKFLLPKTYNKGFVKTISQIADIFIMAHEYGHTILHLSSRSVKDKFDKYIKSFSFHINHKDTISKSFIEEYEADAYGTEFVIRKFFIQMKVDFTTCLLGIEFFFTALEIKSSILQMSTSDSHPTIVNRWHYINQFVKNKYPQYYLEYLNQKGSLRTLLLKQWELNKQEIVSKILSYGQKGEERF